MSDFSGSLSFDDQLSQLAFSLAVNGETLDSSQYSIQLVGSSLEVSLNNRVYNDQTLTVSYNPDELPGATAVPDFAPPGALTDEAGNPVQAFSQIVDLAAITEAAPDLIPPQVTASSTSIDGKEINLRFSELLNTTPPIDAFNININGNDIPL